MSIIFVLMGLSLFVAVLSLFAFFWNIKSGQYDDDYTPSVRMLFDDKPPSNKTDSKEKKLN